MTNGLRAPRLARRAFACLCIGMALMAAVAFLGGRVSAMGTPSDPYWVMGALRMELDCISPPSWSPDGKRLAFIVESSEDYKMHIATVDVATRAVKVFCRGWAPNWSPRGELIAFLDYEPGKGDGLYVLPANGGSPRRVSPAPVGDWTVWSPDGRHLAFERFTEWESPPKYAGAMRIACGDVCIADTASGVVKRLTDFARAFPPNARYLSASPMGWTGNGELVVVLDAGAKDGLSVDGLPGVYLVDPSTLRLRKLLDGEFATAMVSPDGSEVILTREHSREDEDGLPDRQTEVLLIRMAEPQTQTVALTSYGEAFSAASVSWWGRRLVGSGRRLDRDAAERLPSHVLTSIDLDSGERRVLTPLAVRDGAPAVSPDGSQVAFYRRGDQDAGLCVMDVHGRRAQVIGPHDP